MSEEYGRPPIFEAAIEARLASPVSEDDLARLESAFASRFPHKEEEVEIEFKLEIGASSQATGKKVGVRFTSADAADVIIVKRGAFLMARRAPYQGWPILLAATLEAWDKWTKIIGKTKKFSRLGVRYQNRIDVPLDENHRFAPEPYVGLLPLRPPVLQKPAQLFATQVHGIAVDDYLVNVNVASIPSPLIGHAGILVDIDVYIEQPMDFGALVQRLHGVREVKNTVFESLLKDPARETFRV